MRAAKRIDVFAAALHARMTLAQALQPRSVN